MNTKTTPCSRLIFLFIFLLLVAVEVFIALFVHDRLVRPYVGDIIVVAVIYCFIRIFIPYGVKLLPLYIFLFATAVEIAQYFDFVTLLGLGDSKFFRVLLGTSYSFVDILCYASGAAVCFGAEYFIRRNKGTVK